MPGQLLHVGATVLCMHGGQASPTTPSPRVRVGGQPAATTATPYAVAGCPFNAAGAPVPCVTAQWVIGAARVRSAGMPLLLTDSQAMCAPNGTGVTVLATQLRVKAT